MRSNTSRHKLKDEMETILDECLQQINRAIREYRTEVESAVEDLRENLDAPPSAVH